jgi:hypothetical protein
MSSSDFVSFCEENSHQDMSWKHGRKRPGVYGWSPGASAGGSDEPIKRAVLDSLLLKPRRRRRGILKAVTQARGDIYQNAEKEYFRS